MKVSWLHILVNWISAPNVPLAWLVSSPPPSSSLSLFPGMGSVQLKRMWLQNCCLGATAAETRDPGQDLQDLCDLDRVHLDIEELPILHSLCSLTDTMTPTCGDSAAPLPPTGTQAVFVSHVPVL